MYRKMIFVVIILLSFVEIASCKTIFVGIMGGPGMYLGNVAEGVFYDPKAYAYGTHDPKLIAQNFTGMDAMSKYIEKRIHGSYLARIYHTSVGGGDIANWIESNYQKGDIVLISGYSAGAGIALTVAWGLQDKGIEVDIMGLIDKVSLADDYITSNVKKVYVFYQRNPLNFDENSPNVNKLHGENEFNVEDSNKTSIDSFLISNTTHRLIDNNPASWEVLSVYMVGYINTLIDNGNVDTSTLNPTSFRFTPQKVINRCKAKLEGNLSKHGLQLDKWQNLHVIKYKKVFDPQTQGNLYDFIVSGTMIFYNEGAPSVTILCRSLGGEKGILAAYDENTAVFINTKIQDHKAFKANKEDLVKEADDETFVPTARDILSQALEQTKDLPL